MTRYYPLDFTLDEIREGYAFDVSCAGSVPQAMEAFLEAEDFEDALRNAVSIDVYKRQTFTKTLTLGDGLTAQMLKKHGITVYGESQIEELIGSRPFFFSI